jgi:hypothetical protein
MAKAKKPAPAALGVIAQACCATAPAAIDIGANPVRAYANERHRWLWRSGETLRYRFLTHNDSWQPASSAEVDAARAAFKAWADLGIGLIIQETKKVADRPQIHVAFDQSDATWSKLGTEANGVDQYEKTMNFSRTLLDAEGKKLALHEVGHALGLKHEHQNPTQGIVWKDENEVRAYFAKEKRWSDSVTNESVIQRFGSDDFEGWPWDADSIMNYELPARLIKNRTQAVAPVGISRGDKDRLRRFYPGVNAHNVHTLKPFLSAPLPQKSGEQAFFEFKPDESRKYTITTFGELDVSMSLYEQGDDGMERYMATDADGGLNTNASIETRLFAGRRYVVRMRVLYTAAPGQAALVLY